MIRLHAPLYLLVALASAALAALQPVEAESLDAGSVVAITDQVLTTLAVDDASAAPAQAE
ncbi:hypothetical protein [Ideonella sp.]|uniref:hypothetical protein n=1 Tax=Ideonella sp. TaxID=1929293 RepID=UPI0035B42063